MGLKLKASNGNIAFNGKEPIYVSGVYYVPYIDEEGYLHWVASGANMPELEKVYVRGADGYTPIKGVDYFDGYTPLKGVDYFDGEKGDSGVYIGSTPGENDRVWIEPTDDEVIRNVNEEEF